MAFLDPIFNPVLIPLLNWNPFVGIIILTLVISLIVTIIYKYVTNQEQMKSMKEKQKEHQQKMKELKNNPEEMMKVQKEAMKLNLEFMKHSFKPTLITMIPLLLIFGWMTGHLAYEPIFPGETYSITAIFKEGLVGEAQLVIDEETEILSNVTQPITDKMATWSLKSKEGSHELKVKTGQIEETKKVLISKNLEYEEQFTVYPHSDIEQININYNQLKPMGNFEIFGWQPGWLGLYLIFSIIFSIGLRKIMNVY